MLNSRQFPINTRLGNSSLVLLGRASRRWDPNHFTQLIDRNLQKFRDLLYEFIDDFHLDVEPEVLTRWTNQGSARSAHRKSTEQRRTVLELVLMDLWLGYKISGLFVAKFHKRRRRGKKSLACDFCFVETAGGALFMVRKLIQPSVTTVKR